MAIIDTFKKIFSNYNGQTPSTGKEVEDAFNDNFDVVKQSVNTIHDGLESLETDILLTLDGYVYNGRNSGIINIESLGSPASLTAYNSKAYISAYGGNVGLHSYGGDAEISGSDIYLKSSRGGKVYYNDNEIATVDKVESLESDILLIRDTYVHNGGNNPMIQIATTSSDGISLFGINGPVALNGAKGVQIKNNGSTVLSTTSGSTNLSSPIRTAFPSELYLSENNSHLYGKSIMLEAADFIELITHNQSITMSDYDIRLETLREGGKVYYNDEEVATVTDLDNYVYNGINEKHVNIQAYGNPAQLTANSSIAFVSAYGGNAGLHSYGGDAEVTGSDVFLRSSGKVYYNNEEIATVNLFDSYIKNDYTNSSLTIGTNDTPILITEAGGYRTKLFSAASNLSYIDLMPSSIAIDTGAIYLRAAEDAYLNDYRILTDFDLAYPYLPNDLTFTGQQGNICVMENQQYMPVISLSSDKTTIAANQVGVSRLDNTELVVSSSSVAVKAEGYYVAAFFEFGSYFYDKVFLDGISNRRDSTDIDVLIRNSGSGEMMILSKDELKAWLGIN